MEKSLIDGEAGNDEPDFGGADDVDDADANPELLLFPPLPSSAADERCESRRMSEDMVCREREEVVGLRAFRRFGGGG